MTPDGKPAPDAESVWTIWGDFDSEVRLVNASDEELGLLFAALGVGAPSPMVRLGGKKYHGFGAADVELLGAAQAHPERISIEPAAVKTWAEGLARRAITGVEARRIAWEDLHTVMSRG